MCSSDLIYRTIASSLSGMQELMAVERIDQLILRGFDNIVVDTAPSRHALDVFDKPELFADFSDSRRVRFVSRTYQFAEAVGLTAIGRGALEFYSRVESILGANMVRNAVLCGVRVVCSRAPPTRTKDSGDTHCHKERKKDLGEIVRFS